MTLRNGGALWRAVILAGCCITAGLSPASAQTTLTRDQQIEDLTVLERQYVPRERAYEPREREAALALIADLKKRAGTLTDDQLYLGVLRVAALADNAHSLGGYSKTVTPPSRGGLPFIVAMMDEDGLLVLRARPPFEDLAGTLIVDVEGRPVADVMTALGQYYGGTTSRRRILAAGLFRTGRMLNAAGLAASADRVRLTFRRPSGETFERTVDYVAAPPGAGAAWWLSRWWSPDPLPNDTTVWATAVPRAGLPLYLQDADKLFRTQALPDLQALYMQFWTNEANRGIVDFVRNADNEITKLKPKNLIVDLRFDKGGDLRLNADLMRGLGARIPADGRVYLIVGRYTLSAAMVVASIAIKAGGNNVRVVGEAPGDVLQFWSEGGTVDLPNSHYAVRYTDGYFDLLDGCVGEPGCHPENARYDFVIGPRGLDLPAAMTTAAYMARRDPAMEAIQKDIAARKAMGN